MGMCRFGTKGAAARSARVGVTSGRFLQAVVTLAVLGLAASPAPAAVSYWNGGTSADWGTAENWSAGVPGDIAGFNSAAPLFQPSVGGVAQTVAGLQMDSASGPIAISAGAGGSLGISGGGVNVAGGSGGLTISAPIAGAGGLTKTGDGVLVLNNPTPGTGPVAINAGILQLAQTVPTAAAGASIYYSFSDAGNLGLDNTGGGNNAVLRNGPSADPGGVAGGAVSLDGINQYLATSPAAPLTPGMSNTAAGVSLWFKTTTDGRSLYSVNQPEQGGANDRNIWLSGGQANARIWSEQTIATTGLNLADGQWHHLVHTYGPGLSGQRVYIDGVLRASGNKASSDFNWATHFEIGWGNFGTPYFAGSMDEFRFFNGALTQEDVLKLYGTFTNHIDDASPVAVAAGATVDLNGMMEVIGSLADHPTLGAGTVSLGSGTLITGGNDTSTAFSGVISGSGGLTKKGVGTMTLSGASTYTGATTINAGAISAASIVSSGGGSNLGDGTSPVVLGGTTTQGTLSYTGGDATFTRGFQINAGGGRIDHAGSGTLTIAAPGITGAASGSLALGGTGNMAITGPINLGNGAMTVDGGGNTTTISAITKLGSGGLTKTGTGVMVLSAPAIYTGATSIQGGTLRLVAPTAPTGSTLWLDATDSSSIVKDAGGNISQWKDKSGNANDATQPDIARQPVYQSSGSPAGLPTIFFDGNASRGMVTPLNLSSGEFSIFSVYSYRSTDTATLHRAVQGTSNWLMGPYQGKYQVYSGDGPGWVPNPPNTVANALIEHTVIETPSLIGSYINGTQVGTLANPKYPGILLLAAGGNLTNPPYNEPLNGDIAELLVFPAAMADEQRLAIENYLIAKWTNGGLLPYNSPLNINAGATLDLNGMTQMIGPLSDGVAGGGSLVLGAVGSPGALTINSTAGSAFSGIISGNGAVRKTGTGTLTLSGASTYTGATTVNAGKLLVASPGSLTSAVTVNSGGTLGGNGSTGGIILASGARVAPGTDATPIGALTTSTLDLQSGSVVDIEFADPATSNDQINVTTPGGLSINGAGIHLYQAGTTNAFQATGTYNLFAASGSIGGAGLGSLALLNRNPEIQYTLGYSGGHVTLGIAETTMWLGGSSVNWSDEGNWSSGLPRPANTINLGDALIFYLGGGESHNDHSGGPFTSLRFKDQIDPDLTLTGTGVTLTGDSSGHIILNESANTPTVNLPITMAGAGAINAQGGSITVNGTVNNGGYALTVKGANNTTLGGTVSGAGSLTKIDSGTLTLGAANTFSGDTRVGAGTLAVAHAEALKGTTLDMNKDDSGAVSFGSLPAVALGGLKGSRNLNLGGAVTTVGANNANTTFTGVLSGGTGLMKAGTGVLTLQNNNTYGGPTVVSVGTLKLGPLVPPVSGAAIWLDATDTARIVKNGANLVSQWQDSAGGTDKITQADPNRQPTYVPGGINGLPVIHFSTAGTPDFLNNTTNYTSPVTVFSVSRLTGGSISRLITSTSNNWLLGYWGGYMDSAYFDGDVHLTGVAADTNPHMYEAVIGGPGQNSAVYRYDNRNPGGVVLYGGPNQNGVTGPNGLSLGLWPPNAPETSDGDVGEVLIFKRVMTDAERKVVEDYLIAKWWGAGAFFNNIPDTSVVSIADGATLDLNDTAEVIGGLADADPHVLGTGKIAVGTSGVGKLIVNQTTDAAFSGVIAGSGAFIKDGAAALTLNGLSTFTGDTRVKAGTLKIGNPLSLQFSNLDMNTADAGTFDMNGNDTTLGGLKGSRNLMIPTGKTLSVGNNSQNTSYSGILGGDGALKKIGAGTLSLSGLNNYSGNTTIVDGALNVGEGSSLPGTLLVFNGTTPAAAPVLEGRGTFTRNVGASAGEVQWLASGGFSAQGGTLAVQLSGGAGLTWNTGSFVPNGSNLAFGSKTADSLVDFQNAIDLGGADRTVFVQKSTASSADVAQISGQISNGGLVKDGPGVLALAGANTFAGDLTVKAGALRVANPAALDSASRVSFTAGSTGVLQLNGNALLASSLHSADPASPGTSAVENASPTAATLTVNKTGGTDTFAGMIRDGAGGGALTLVKDGSGTLVLTGANGYTGGTTVADGSLEVNTVSLPRSVSVTAPAAKVVFNQATDGLYQGSVSGTGGLEKTGAGALTLSSFTESTYSGPTTVSQGTLRLRSTLTAPSGATVQFSFDDPANLAQNGGTLGLDGYARNSPGSTTGGIGGGSLSLNGTNWVSANVGGDPTAYGVAMWIKTTSLNVGFYSVNNPEQGGENDRNLWLVNGHPRSRVWSEETIGNDTLNLADGQWHHVVQTYGGTAGAHKLYIDGALAATGAKTYSDFNWSTWIEVGWGNQGYFNGEMDEFRLYNGKALTQDDVTALYQSGLGGSLAGRIGDQSAVKIASGATLDLNGVSETIGSLEGPLGGSVLLGNGTLTTGGNDGNTTFSGAISGTGGSLIKVGAGTLELAGVNTYDAGTTVQTGTLLVSKAGALPSGAALTIGEGGTAVLASGLSVAGAASQQGSAAPVPEPGTLVLLAVAMFAGLAIWTRKRLGIG